jgi:hypothetical protein
MKHYYREKIVKAVVNYVEQEIEFPNIKIGNPEPTMSSHQPFQTAFAKGVLWKIFVNLLLNVMMKTLYGIWGEKNISEVCNIWNTFRAGTGSTEKINEFSDYVDIDAHALLEIVQMKLKKSK